MYMKSLRTFEICLYGLTMEFLRLILVRINYVILNTNKIVEAMRVGKKYLYYHCCKFNTSIAM